MADMSLTNTSKPSFFARMAAPAPLSPAPNMTILFCMGLMVSVGLMSLMGLMGFILPLM